MGGHAISESKEREMKAKENRFEKYKGCECATLVLKTAPQDCQNASERNETNRTILGSLIGAGYAVGTFDAIENRLIAIDYERKGNLKEYLQKLVLYTKYNFTFSMKTSLEECENASSASILTIKGFDIPSRWVVTQMAKAVSAVAL